MGWTYQQARGRTPLQVIKDEFSEEVNFIATNRVGNEIYAACSTKKNPDVVFGVVFMVKAKNGEVGYKEIVEDEGPFYYAASKRVIDSLTEAKTTTAQEWRDKCREEQEVQFKLKDGMHIKFDPPLEFITGESFSEFIVLNNRKRLFKPIEGGMASQYQIDLGTIKRSISCNRLTAV